MPTYEYECKKCRHHFEVFQSMSDDPIKKCPECGKSARRLVSGGMGVIFKGSGFYVTDKDAKTKEEKKEKTKESNTKEESKKGSGESGVGSGKEKKAVPVGTA
jgi:putative FmdB family regulatory protein